MTPYDRGYDAYHEGGTNPYPQGSDDYDDFELGYDAAHYDDNDGWDDDDAGDCPI